MAGGEAESTIITTVVKDLLGDTAESVAKDAAKDGAESAVKDGSETVAKDVVRDGEENAGKDAARDSGKPLEDGETGKSTDARSETKDPIDVATGEVLFAETDLSLSGVLPLVIKRMHVSSYRQGGLYGISWASTLDQRLEVNGDAIRYAAPDGTIRTYPPAFSTGIELAPTTGPVRPLTWLGSDGYVIDDPRSRHRLHFPPTGGVHGSRPPISAISDRNGNRITFHRDQTGVLTEIQHSGGHRIAVDTDGAGHRSRVRALRLLDSPDGEGGQGSATDQGIVILRYGYDAAGNLTEVINSSGLSLRFSYDGEGRMTGWRDRNDHEYRYDFDEQGRAIRGYGTNGFLNASLVYDPAGRRTVLTDSLGRQTTYHLNDRGQVITETDPLGHATTSEWDERDQLIARTDPLGRITRYTYDQYGNATLVQRPDGAQVQVRFDERGNPLQLTRADGTTWRNDYDQVGNLTATTDPTGATTRYGYDERGGLISVTDALGNTTRADTNGMGLPAQITDPLGSTVRYGRDGLGRVVSITSPTGGTTRYAWSVESRMTSRTLPSGATETWEYDPEGNQVIHTDAVGQATRTTYGPFDVPTSRTDPDGIRLEFGYNTELQLAKVTNPHGLTWEYTFDPAGNLVAESDFDNRALGYAHDAAGQLVHRVNGAGETTDYVRDALGNISEQRSGGKVTGFTYDALGRVTRAVSPGADLTFQYDPSDRIVAETCNGRTLTSAYDALGRRIHRRTPSGSETTWASDRAGRTQGMTTGGQSLRFTYDADGNETQRHIGAGAILDQRYDTDHRLISQALWGAPDSHRPAGTAPGEGQAGPRLLQHRSYRRRPDGYVTAIGDRLNGNRTVDLDRAGRVTAVNAENWSERYAYDSAGNLTHTSVGDQPPHDDPLSATAGDRAYSGTLLRHAGRTFYEHDPQGRIIRRRYRTLSGQTREWTYNWDADDRLVAVTTPTGQSWRYHYDPLGRRISKQCVGPRNAILEQIEFAWDGPVLVEQVHTYRQERGPVTRTTTWDYRPGTSTPLTQTERVALADNSQQWVDRQFQAIVTDLVGSPAEMVDPNGNITRQTRTTLWGYDLPNRADTVYCPLRFAGQYYDPETGLHYNYHRYYDPTTGRYGSADPLGLAAGLGPHNYVVNPHVWNDPLGLKGAEEDDAWGDRNEPDDPEPPQPLGHGHTGRFTPRNMNERLAMDEAMADPESGVVIPVRGGMNDPRWPGNAGWVKMEQEVNGVNVHYVRNTLTGQVDDYKFKE